MLNFLLILIAAVAGVLLLISFLATCAGVALLLMFGA